MTLTEVLVLVGILGGLGAQFGWIKWWMGKTDTAVAKLVEDFGQHLLEDKAMHEQLQALAVNEANVGGTLATLALEIKQIRKDLDEREQINGKMLQLKLDDQTNKLILKMRDMIADLKREIHNQ